MSLALVEQRTINNVLIDGYYGDKDAWFTRTQIGEALGYDNPQDSIKKIHKRHRERLDLFSKWGQIDPASGVREGYVYNTRGVLEICRWSRQPKANMVMDALYDMAMSVIDKGYYAVMSDLELLKMLAEKCINKPGLYQQFSKSGLKDMIKLQLQDEKNDAQQIIEGYDYKCSQLVKYYNKHPKEDGFVEKSEKYKKEAFEALAEKCPHLDIIGLSKSMIRTKSGIEI